MSEKLQKILARSGVGSRREMETWISAGRVTIDGKLATLGDRVLPTQAVRVDGHPVKLASEAEQICRVIAYHKPEGEICSVPIRKVVQPCSTAYQKFVIHAGLPYAGLISTPQVCCCSPPMVNLPTA